jgi:mannose-1-phosphate guanylyltransferase / mannose-6-phosphate isomerase
MKVLPVIMSGGAGSRLWPVSTPESPKQFHAMGSDLSMIQESLLRVSGHEPVDFLPAVVVCNERHASIVLEQIRGLTREPEAIVLEPVGRNTAPVAAVASLLALERYPGSLVLLLPADHVITDAPAFREAVARAVPIAGDYIVTFGIKPSGPETGYGYIRSGESLANGIARAEAFIEKPDRETARRYLEAGDYFWNSGIFLFSPDLLLKEMRKTRPDVEQAAGEAFRLARREGLYARLDEATFRQCPSESLDYAVMERTTRAAVVPCEVGWADLGSWSELWRLGRGLGGNFVHGDAVVLESSDALIWAEDVKVGVVGVSELIVVATREGVLVAPMSRAQEVKMVVEAMNARTSARESTVPRRDT